jgi:hypothetical protein
MKQDDNYKTDKPIKREIKRERERERERERKIGTCTIGNN